MLLYNACVMPRLKIICFLLIYLVSSVTLIYVNGWWHTFTFSFAKTLRCILETNNIICMYYFFNSVMYMPLKVLNKVWRVHTLLVSDITILTNNSFQCKAKLYKLTGFSSHLDSCLQSRMKAIWAVFFIEFYFAVQPC